MHAGKLRLQAARACAYSAGGPGSTGRRDRGTHAEPLLGAPCLEPLYLGEPQLRREAHRADVGGLCREYHRLAGYDAVEPAECRSARLGGVPESPRPWQEQVAEIELPHGSRATVLGCSSEQDLSDHRPVEINDEAPRPPPGHLRHLTLELVARAGTADVSVHLWRGEQLDERRTVPSLGFTEHEPLGPDRPRRPSHESQILHPRTLTNRQTTPAQVQRPRSTQELIAQGCAVSYRGERRTTRDRAGWTAWSAGTNASVT